MTPEEQQNAYRAQCDYARKNATVTDCGNGGKKHFDSINAAKRWVRENARFKTFRAD